MAKASVRYLIRSCPLAGLWVGRVCAALLIISLGGCSLLQSAKTPGTGSSRGWLTDGSLAISRPLPPVNVFPTERASLRQESFPSRSVPTTQTTIRIQRAAGKLSLSGPETSPLSFNVHVASSLKSGRYTVALKQANPLWYAPASYFRQRDLKIPAEGSRERFKRGALGSQALFLSDQTPLHSGPVGTNEIGGLRLNPADMDELFKLVQVGTVVEVR